MKGHGYRGGATGDQVQTISDHELFTILST